MYTGADWLKLICLSEGGERSITTQRCYRLPALQSSSCHVVPLLCHLSLAQSCRRPSAISLSPKSFGSVVVPLLCYLPLAPSCHRPSAPSSSPNSDIVPQLCRPPFDPSCHRPTALSSSHNFVIVLLYPLLSRVPLLCHRPLAPSLLPARSSSPCSVVVPLHRHCIPCSVIIPLLCRRPLVPSLLPAQSSSPCSVVVPLHRHCCLLGHHPPALSSSPCTCLLYTSPSPRDCIVSRMPSSA